MNDFMYEDTIAAIATAYGEGGIGIIRISGDKSLDILKKIFRYKGEIRDRYMNYGHIVDFRSGQMIDEVMAVYMKAPRTYTREDVVEINCHGSMVSLNKTLELVLSCGARLAERGEFTERAFFNGRIDLSQAEAVIDLVRAKTEKSFDVALSQLQGAFSLKVNKIRDKLLDIQVDIAVNIDYPDEDIEELTFDKLSGEIRFCISQINDILTTARAGRFIREGINIAILGKPNVGKSSLLNALLRDNRAIVTDVPGTTRDTIEESVNIRNIPVNIIDTAGIRQTHDEVEVIGIEKSKSAFNRADFVIMVIDGSRELTDEDLNILEYVKSKKSLIVINKIDKGNVIDADKIHSISPNCDVVYTCLRDLRDTDYSSDNNVIDLLSFKEMTDSGELSATLHDVTFNITDYGISQIEDVIEKVVYGGQVSQKSSEMVTNTRHIDILRKSELSLQSALNCANNMYALDFIECDIRDAYDSLGEITGDSVSDDVINEVFARFCLGK